jgi:hypothetical protein
MPVVDLEIQIHELQSNLGPQHPSGGYEYVRSGFRSIFLRPISPYGFALRSKTRTGYEAERFLEFYRAGLEYIIELNRHGVDLRSRQRFTVSRSFG